MSAIPTLDVRAMIAGGVFAAVVLTWLIALRGVRNYQGAFVETMAAGLQRNFIVANPHALFAISVVLTLILGASAYALLGPLGGVAAVLLAGAGPRLVIAYLARQRTRRFVYQLPDALLALASALRAGANLTQALELLAARQPAPLSQEFTIVLAEYRVGRQLAESLADLRQRIDSPELDLMNTAINVSRRVGGNLADTLESLARTLQEKAHVEGKIDALTAMGRAQGWVVGLLPLFIGAVLYGQQPERMRLMFTEWYGWLVLAVIAAMMSVAAWMIRRIVNIDV